MDAVHADGVFIAVFCVFVRIAVMGTIALYGHFGLRVRSA